MLTSFGDHGTAVRMADNDRRINVVEYRAECGGIFCQATGHAVTLSLTARRQCHRSTSDVGFFVQQGGRWAPPPVAVSHECAVYENDFHQGILSRGK